MAKIFKDGITQDSVTGQIYQVGRSADAIDAPAAPTSVQNPVAQKRTVDQEIEDYINSLWVADEYKQILRTVAADNYTTGLKIKSEADIDNVIKLATTNAEASLDPYYKKVTSQNIEDMKRNLWDIRQNAANYLSTEKVSYADLLDKTKKSLRARGLTFSWESRKVLWSKSALQDLWNEWTLNEKRRIDIITDLDKYKQLAADQWVKYERLLWSDVVSGLWTIQDPYSTWTKYNEAWQYDIYNKYWNVKSDESSLALERLKAIEQRKQANTKALTQSY